MLSNKFIEEVRDSITPLITYAGITETTINPDPTDTSLTGELAGRFSMSSSTSGDSAVFLGTRSSAAVIDTTNGDNWKGIGFFNASTSGDMFASISTTGILQTTSFDVEVEITITPQRT